MTIDAYSNVLAALCLWREARGSSREAKRAVYWAIQNRALDAAGRWPRHTAGVILQRWQFSSFNPGDPNAVKFPLPGPEWEAFADCCAIVDEPGDDLTAGANHYESVGAGQPLPSWADPEKITLRVGTFRFYRL